MRTSVIFFLISAIVAVSIAGDAKLQVLQSNGKFTNDLYKILSKNEGNIFLSPISVHTALSMTYLGSDGSTQRALKTSLVLPDPETTADGYQTISRELTNVQKVTLLIANKIYIRNLYHLKENFKKKVVNKFNSEVELIDFDDKEAAVNTINAWVEGKTNNKIKNLIESSDIDPLFTTMILVNAIYFKGNWLHKFRKEATRTEPFYLNDKDKIDVQMMHIQRGFNCKYDTTLKAKILELPYANQEISMVILLPDKKDGIKDLETQLPNVDLTKITEGTHWLDLHVALPKFKIETSTQLKYPLMEMGLAQIFAEEANFSKIIEEEKRMYVKDVIHKAFIEVNEEGAEAAAATGVPVLVPVSAPLYQYFGIDHPFIFLLKSGSTTLFIGRCNLPESGNNIKAPIGNIRTDYPGVLFTI